MEVTIKIEAPEIAKALLKLAASCSKREQINGKDEDGTENRYEQLELDLFPQTTPVTLEEVRAKLAALAQSGKQSEVKNLISRFGASKLTKIPESKYADLLAAASLINKKEDDINE